MKYFISSRWRNRDQVLELTKKLRTKNQFVYCFFEHSKNMHSVDMDPELAMKEFESISNWRKNKFVQDIYQDAIDKIRDSDCLVLLLPAGASAHIEAGIAFGLGKKCILIGDKREAESMYLVFNEFYNSIDEFINYLK